MTLFGIQFVKPVYLVAAALLPVVYLLSLHFQKRRQERLERFSSRTLWDRIIPELDWAAARRKFLFWCLSLFFLLVALARPQWGEHEETLKTTGLDMMIVLDVSKSMDTEDVVPSRLKKVRRSMRYLLERMQGDRVGLVLYAGSAHLHSPLTTDLNYIQELISEASPVSVTNQGTDIGAALEVAVRALDRGAEQLKRESESVPKTRIVLLVGDGEDHENQIDSGASRLKDADVKFYAFGVGTEKGGPIPMRDETGQNHGFKRTKKGETVTSKANLAALNRLADRVDGKFWALGDSEIEVDELVNELSALSRGELDERKIAVKEERFQTFLAIGILFFLIELSLSLRRRMAGSGSVSRGTALGGLGFLILTGPVLEASASSAPSLKAYRENQAAIQAFEQDRVSEAKRAFGRAQVEDPDSPDLSYNQGVVQLKEGNLEEAILGFQRATKQAEGDGRHELAARSLYNEGIAQTAKKDPEAAVSAYLKALEANRKRPDPELERRIRKNLELLVQQQQQQQNQDQQKSDQKQDQSDQTGESKDQSDSNQSGKNKNSDDSKGDEKKDQNGEQDKPEEKSEKEKQAEKKKREFKSKQLKPEDAERVMAELSRREKELKQKLERQKGRPQSLEKDW